MKPLNQRFRPRDSKGRFVSYLKPHGHSSCGKKQYKSYECKAKSIQKSAIERGEATPSQQPYIQWLNKNGLGVRSRAAARRRGWLD
jgi:hypothetical protein